jgi:geranylgeranyl diphosphate synthase type II
MGELASEMARIKSRVDGLILQELLPRSDSAAEVDLLYKMMRDYPERPAKGLRPFVCVMSSRAFGGSEDDAFLTAAAIELFQNWILIHDDLEDGSELRRGMPALHKKYDWTLALNAGDALHARMWGALLNNARILGNEKTLGIMQEFSRMVNETTEGQHMELSWTVGKRWDLRESDYYLMCTKKTAWYTAVSPLRLGGIIAGAKKEPLQELIDIGSKLGVAFQIQDDVLNLVGDTGRYGKESGGDLREGKRTLILLKALELSSPVDRTRIVEIMNKNSEEKSQADLEFVTSVIQEHGVINYANKSAVDLVEKARSALRKIKWGGDRQSVELLDQVARFAVEREW